MTPQSQHDAEDRLRDLMALGDMARRVCNLGIDTGEMQTVPTEWLGLFGRLAHRLAHETSELLGNLPNLT